MRGRRGSSLLPPPGCPPPRPPRSLPPRPGPPRTPSPRRPGAPPVGPRARPLAWRLPAGLAQPGPFAPPRTLGFPRGAARLAPRSPAPRGPRLLLRAGFAPPVGPHGALQPAGLGALCLPPLLRAVPCVWQDWDTSAPELGRVFCSPIRSGQPVAPCTWVTRREDGMASGSG